MTKWFLVGAVALAAALWAMWPAAPKTTPAAAKAEAPKDANRAPVASPHRPTLDPTGAHPEVEAARPETRHATPVEPGSFLVGDELRRARLEGKSDRPFSAKNLVSVRNALRKVVWECHRRAGAPAKGASVEVALAVSSDGETISVNQANVVRGPEVDDLADCVKAGFEGASVAPADAVDAFDSYELSQRLKLM